MEALDEFGVLASGFFKKRLMNLLKFLFAAVPQCISLVALVIWCKFMYEPHLNGVVRITHFVCDDVVRQCKPKTTATKMLAKWSEEWKSRKTKVLVNPWDLLEIQHLDYFHKKLWTDIFCMNFSFQEQKTQQPWVGEGWRDLWSQLETLCLISQPRCQNQIR